MNDTAESARADFAHGDFGEAEGEASIAESAWLDLAHGDFGVGGASVSLTIA
jgi:hypothetical protein